MNRQVVSKVAVGLFGVLIALPAAAFLGHSHLSAQTIRPARRKPETPPNSSEDSWQVTYLGKSRIGYERSTSKPLIRNGRRFIQTSTETSMTVLRFGQKQHMRMRLETEETPDGDLQAFSLELQNPPAETKTTAGQVIADRTVSGRLQMRLTTTIAGRRQERFVPWEPHVKSSAYQERLARTPPLQRRQRRSFRMYLAEFNKVTKVTLAAGDFVYIKLLDGKRHKLLKVRIRQALLPQLPIRAYLDSRGRVLKTEMEIAGQNMVSYRVSRSEALKEIAGAELDFAVKTLIHVKRILRGHRSRKVVYRITMKEDNPSRYFVSGPTQQIRRISGDTIELTVTSVPLPDRGRLTRAKPEYLAPSRYLQSDDLRVRQHADRAAIGLTDTAQIASAMEKHVHRILKNKNFSTALASAAEVARHLEGDCTEHAVLLAAMLRAKKIPSRIAVGLVYVESLSAFGGHMWTEAKIGKTWIPLDATLGRGGIGAAHLKMVDSSFANDGPAPITTFLPLLKVLGRTTIKVVKAE